VSKSTFRLLILGSWVLIVTAVAAHFIALRGLPVELRGWLEAYKTEPQNRVSTLKLVLDVLYLTSCLVISVGLFAFGGGPNPFSYRALQWGSCLAGQSGSM
jgi:hypothetical protein